MSQSVLVQIIGAKIACAEGVKDSWREVAGWAAAKLKARFGAEVQVQYYDLFDTDCPALRPGAQLPVVMVAGEMISNGGKISIPLLSRHIAALGILSTS
jgi:disulfide oxidoreductase YuzD